MLKSSNELIEKLSFTFRKSLLYKYLKKIKILRLLREKTGKVIGDWMLYNFRLHGDKIHLNTLRKIIKEHGISSIVETGTYLGYATELFAKTFPDLQIYTCEINKDFYLKAKKNLAEIKNVHVYNESSPEFIESLIKNDLLGDRPFFYLDAHWLDDWPLEKELQLISKKIKTAVISIDDFKVYNDNRFVFDKYKDKECSLELVAPNLKKNNEYQVLFPHYGKEELYKDKIIHPDLIGYVIIFQNMAREFESLKKNNFIKRYYMDGSDVLKKTLLCGKKIF